MITHLLIGVNPRTYVLPIYHYSNPQKAGTVNHHEMFVGLFLFYFFLGYYYSIYVWE